jgi:hypothetical protein
MRIHTDPLTPTLALASVLVFALVPAACSTASTDPDTDPDAGPSGDGGPGDDGAPLVDPAWPADEPLPAAFDFPPYLNLFDGQTVVVSWRTAAATTGIVRFGRTEGLGSEARSQAPANLHHVTLSGLEPKAAYFYEVIVDGAGARRRGVFVMPGRTQWRFMHAGEFHAPSNAGNVAKFAEEIRAFRPHVLVESGDMVDDGNDLAHWRSYLRTSAPWISNVLLLPAHSNHVNGSGGNTNLRDLFAVAGNERWYTTRYGQVQFFSLDSTYSANADVTTAELPWLRTEAARAHDGVDDPRFVIAAWHHPACSSQYWLRDVEREWVQSNLVAAFTGAGGVDLILAAHDKYYERSTITGGIVHLITNIGEVAPNIPGGNHPACTAVKTDRGARTTAFVTVDGDALAAKIVLDSGAELDSFSIRK